MVEMESHASSAVSGPNLRKTLSLMKLLGSWGPSQTEYSAEVNDDSGAVCPRTQPSSLATSILRQHSMRGYFGSAPFWPVLVPLIVRVHLCGVSLRRVSVP